MSVERIYYETALHWQVGVFDDPFEKRRLQACVEALPSDAELSLLDVGAGNGVFLSLVERLRPDLRLQGVERSRAAIAAKTCDAPVREASADALPFDDGAFDLVSSLDVIEHLPHRVYEQALQEIARVSRRWVLLNVPDREVRLTTACPYCGCRFNPHYHMRSFEPAQMEMLLPGFRVVRCDLVKRRESIMKGLARPFRRSVYGGFPPYAVCPQCSFTAVQLQQQDHPGVSQQARPAGARVLRRVADMLPKMEVPGEIIVLYERLKVDGP